MNDYSGTGGLSAQALLAESVYYQKKAVARGVVAVVAHVLLIVVLAAVLVSGILLAPRVGRLLSQAEESLDEIGVILEDVRSVTSSAKTMFEEDAGSMKDAVDKLNEVDFGKLNEAIGNLSGAADRGSGQNAQK